MYPVKIARYVSVIACCLMSYTLLYGQSESRVTDFVLQNKEGQLYLNEAGASHFAQLALDCLQKEYPNKLNQVAQSADMIQEPHELHPAFYGCFDWHSSVHGHWMLVKLLKQFPDLPEAARIRQVLQQNLTAENIAVEVSYLRQASKSWERMYGWAWLLKLAEELYRWNDTQGLLWYNNLLPLTEEIVLRYETFLPLQKYPVKTGIHSNTAFGLSFAWDYATTTGQKEFQNLVEKRAKDYYLADQNCPADWEPSGEDFLSSCLEEANLMRRVLSKREFNQWFKLFMPKDKLLSIVRPANVTDRSDPKIVHLDGLNLSRAWCMYGIYPNLTKKKFKRIMLRSAFEHMIRALPNVASKHYEGSHWLASFAVYSLSLGIEDPAKVPPAP